MADPNLNFATGVVDGINTGLDFRDRADNRKRQVKDDQRREMLWSQSQEDRERGIARQDQLQGREDIQFKQSQEELEYQKERRSITDEHQDALMPVERQAARTRLATAQTNQRLADQKAKNQEAVGHWQEAIALFEGGEYERSEQAMSKLGDYGYDVEGMSTGAAQQVQDTAEKLVNNQISFDDPAAVKLAQQLLTPSLIQSGRDPERFEISGIVPTGAMDDDGSETYMVTMMDKQTGKPVPATLNRSSADDKDSSDPVMELSAKDLMSATQGFIADSTASTKVRMRAIGARMGQQAFNKSAPDSLEREKTQAQIDKIKAETAKIKGEGSSEGSATSQEDAMRRLFESNYEDSPRLTLIADLLQQDPNFTMEEGSKTMAQVKAMAGDKKYATLGAGDLYQVFQNKQSIEREIVNITGEKTSNFLAQYPNLSEKEQNVVADRIQRVVVQFKDSKINETQLAGRIKALHKEMTKSSPSRPDEVVKNNSSRARTLDQLETANEDVGNIDPSQLRGY